MTISLLKSLPKVKCVKLILFDKSIFLLYLIFLYYNLYDYYYNININNNSIFIDR